MNKRFLCRGKRLDTGLYVTGYYMADTASCSLKTQGKCTRPHDGTDACIFFWDDPFHKYDAIEVDPATVEPVAVKVIISNSFEVSCPNCQTMVGDKDNYLYDDFLNYCPDCGQRLDWRIGGDGE